MIASKVICDKTYSNKAWMSIAQDLFGLREINLMEHQMCSYLDWELNVNSETMASFESAVKKDFSWEQDSYPTYPVEMVSKRAVQAVSSTDASPISESNSAMNPILISSKPLVSLVSMTTQIQGADLSPHFALAEQAPCQMEEKVFATAIPAVW
jgi:hypothetical protein